LFLEPRILFALAALAMSGSNVAEAQDFDRESAFLLIPTGARPVGMGRAATAIAGDLQNVRWNPASLGALDAVNPLVSSYDGPLDFVVTEFAAAVPISDFGVLALSAEVQSFGDIPLTGLDSPDTPIGQLSPNNLVVSLGFGRRLVQRLSFGVAAKLIRSELVGQLKGSTFGFDAGLHWLPLANVPLQLGVSALNLGPDLRFDDRPGAEAQPLPARARFGVAYDALSHLLPGKGIQLLLALDLEHAIRNLETGSQYFGVELGVREILFLRGGFIAETLIETNTGTTVGLGVGLGAFRFDLARELGVNQLGDETHLSLSAMF
jgi:hypothetical protein